MNTKKAKLVPVERVAAKLYGVHAHVSRLVKMGFVGAVKAWKDLEDGEKSIWCAVAMATASETA